MNKPAMILSLAANRLFLTVAVIWVAVLATSLAWNCRRLDHSMRILAENEARTSFEKDLVFRLWASMHGGVYVPPTETSPPNPYLAHIPDRDVITTRGKNLTLINPAYMTRQVHELGREQYGLKGHITSLDPIRPENAPDAWETAALLSFKEGAKQATGMETMDGRPHLRFMRPLTTRESCLKCHGHQGYAIGDLHGGISVSVPLTAYLSVAEKQRADLILAHLLVGVLGLVGLGSGRWLLARTEKQLRKLSRAVEQSPVSIVLTDLDGNIEYVNPAFTRVAGYGFDEVIGRNPRVLKSSDKSPEEYKEMWDALASGKEWRGEFKNIRKNGDVFWESASISPISDEQGRITHYVAVKEDITERKRTEEALRQSNRDLEAATARAEDLADQARAATRAKGEFLANMSHEIRTPMNGVIGMTGLLLDTDLTEEQRRYAETIQSSGEALLSLINDILDFSKIDAGRLRMELLDFDLQSLVDDFAAGMALRAHEKCLEFISFIAPDVPRYLRGDPGRLRQILTNLVGNAVKFTERGEVALGVSVEQSGGRIVLLRFTIRDTGIGIPEDKIDLLFDKFSQVDASITRKFGGTGLGLAISKQLAEMMGGEIGVNSTLGRGSEFRFTARFAIREAADRTAAVIPKDLTGLHVLVVDDNATNLEILMKQFAAWGLRPRGVAGGEAALRIAAEAHDRGDPFDLSVVDMQMPGMDGGELGRLLKADPRFQTMPRVMLTSLGRPGDARMSADMGFAAYLNKPVRQSELYDTLALVMADTGKRTPFQPIITRHLAREIQNRRADCPRFSGRILVAEDNPVNRQVALGMLRKFGLRADAVANGHEVLHALRTLPYDLVFMDVQMPEMDGLEATREIRDAEGEAPETSELQSSSRIPIIAMTAGAMDRDRERCFEAGMDDYLVKPVNLEELERVLSKWLAADRSREKEDGAGGSRFHGTAGRTGEDNGRGEREAKIEARQKEDEALPVFDHAALLHRCMDDEDLVRDMLNLFLETIPRRIQDLQDALDAADAGAARMAAHAIRGAALNVGAEALRGVVFEMEKAAGTGDLNVGKKNMGKLAAAFDRLRQEMEKTLRTP